MNVVLNASAVAGWLMSDEALSEGVAAAVTGGGALVAPWLLWVELRSIPVVGERRGRLTPDAVKAFLKAVEDLGIELDTSKPSDRVLDLARRHGLSVYDALYLELTLRRGFPLATLDRALGHAARAEGATLLA